MKIIEHPFEIRLPAHMARILDHRTTLLWLMQKGFNILRPIVYSRDEITGDLIFQQEAVHIHQGGTDLSTDMPQITTKDYV